MTVLEAETKQERARSHGVDPRQLTAARRVVTDLLVATKTYRLFPPHNVNVQTTLVTLQQSFQAYFARYPETLTLETTPHELRFLGEPLFADAGRTKPFAFPLHRDGVVRLAFEPGITLRELTGLLNALRSVLVTVEEDDFLTLLWEQDCARIRAVTTDTLLDPGLIPELPLEHELHDRVFELTGSPAGTDNANTETDLDPVAHSEGGASEKKQVLDEIGRDIFVLTEAERDRLESQVRQSAESTPLLELVDALFLVFQADGSWETFEDVTRLIQSTIESLLLRGEFGVARSLTKRLGEAGHNGTLGTRPLARIEGVIEALGDGPTMTSVCDQLQSTDTVIDEDLLEFFRLLRPNAINALMRPFLHGRHSAALLEVLYQLGGTAAIDQFRVGLDSDQPEVVEHTVELLVRCGQECPITHITPLLDHSNPAIRVLGLNVICRHTGDASHPSVRAAIDDPDRSVRRVAVSALARAPERGAFAALWRLHENRARLANGEQEQILIAVVRCDAALAVELLSPLLGRRAWFGIGRRELQDDQQRAVLAMTRAPSSVVQRALEHFVDHGSRFVQKLCRSALQSFARRSQSPSQSESGPSPRE